MAPDNAVAAVFEALPTLCSRFEETSFIWRTHWEHIVCKRTLRGNFVVLFKTWPCPGWEQERDHRPEVVKWCCENTFSESRHYHTEHHQCHEGQIHSSSRKFPAISLNQKNRQEFLIRFSGLSTYVDFSLLFNLFISFSSLDICILH